LLGGLFVFAPASLAQQFSPIVSVCSEHDFSSGGYSTCTYCHHAEEPGEPAFTINAQSEGCLACHDGTTTEITQHISPGSTSERIERPLSVLQNTALDHPFGVLYDEARLLNPSLKLRIVPLAGKVKLFDGRVECASCHDPHDCSNKPFLRMSNEKSALCMACHEM
jgi:predicted CXXCH cytochrome family protein